MQYTKEQDKQFEAYLLKFQKVYRVRKGDDGIYEIPCKNGDIEPYSLKELCCFQQFKNGLGVNRLLKKLPEYCTVTQSAGCEIVFTFSNQHLEEIAALVKAKKRRVLTPEQKAKAIENLHRYSFQKQTR